MLADVQRFANALKDQGIEPGGVVGIFVLMIAAVAVHPLLVRLDLNAARPGVMDLLNRKVVERGAEED
jgi:hypothetical protein